MAILTFFFARAVVSFATAWLWAPPRFSPSSSSTIEQYGHLRSPLATALLVPTLIYAVVVVFCLEYTLRFVALTLAIAERPQPSSPPAARDNDIKKSSDEKNKPTSKPMVTSHPSNTLRHLHSIGGTKAYFRGLKVYSVYITLYFGLWVLLRSMIRPVFRSGQLGDIVSTLITEIMTSKLHCAWTHAILSLSLSSPPTHLQPTLLSLIPSEGGEPWQPKSLVLPIRP
ncbi:hypothetical protein B0H66DRAFT_570993, partial [Apodospora peruviana]